MAKGRPKESTDKLWSTWREDIIKLYKNGGSDSNVKARIYEDRGSFSNDLWDRWMLEDPIFSETIKTGRILAQSWWEKEGQAGIWVSGQEGADKMNYTGWIMNMKNRFKHDWKDKHEDEEQQAKSIPDLNINVCLNKDQINGDDN